MRYLLVFAALIVPSTGFAETHRLRPTIGHPTFAVRPPVLTVKPGDVSKASRCGASGMSRPAANGRARSARSPSKAPSRATRWSFTSCEVRPNRDTAVSTQGGRFGALVPDGGTAFLNDPFPNGRYIWRLDRERMTGTVDLPGSADEDNHGAARADARPRRHGA